jgi:hypothetical protein
MLGAMPLLNVVSNTSQQRVRSPAVTVVRPTLPSVATLRGGVDDYYDADEDEIDVPAPEGIQEVLLRCVLRRGGSAHVDDICNGVAEHFAALGRLL